MRLGGALGFTQLSVPSVASPARRDIFPVPLCYTGEDQGVSSCPAQRGRGTGGRSPTVEGAQTAPIAQAFDDQSLSASKGPVA
jgi:hypothetical protein